MGSINNHKEPSIFVGGLVLGGAMIGAGMFSLPTIMAGAWFINAWIILIVVAFIMLLSGLYILECISKYGAGANYAVIAKNLLPKPLAYFANLSLIFVLYILIYAYISAAGSVIHGAFIQFSFPVRIEIIFIVFTLCLGATVWWSALLSSRLTSLFLLIKIILFVLAFYGLFINAKPTMLFTLPEGKSTTTLLPFIFVIIPYAITSFGYHGNVCSLYKLYGTPGKVVKSCFLGVTLAFVLYTLWMIGTMGNLPRSEFLTIIGKGGNLEAFIQSLYTVLQNPYIEAFLLWFSISAVFCSFLGVAIGLFDYILDSLSLPETKPGRLKAATLCFLPPLLLCLLFPDGFLIAIAYAGSAACIWAVICPAVMALKARKVFDKGIGFEVKGGTLLIYSVSGFGLFGILCQALAMMGVLPIYK